MILADERAERAVLSAILVRPSCWADVSSLVDPEAFGLERHRVIAAAAWRLRRAGDEVDAVTLGRELEGAPRSTLDTVRELDGDVVANPLRHARTVRDLAAARRLRELLSDLYDDHQAAESDPVAWLDRVARQVTAAADVRRESELRPIGSYVEAHIREVTARAKGPGRGLSTGIAPLDAMTGGLHLGEFVVVAARPSNGKSAAALQIAMNIAEQPGCAVAFFSSEMKAMLILDRAVAERGSVALHRIRDGRLTEDEMRAVISAYKRLQASAVWVSDRRGWRVNEIVAQVRAWKRTQKPGTQCVVLVDYLQLVRASERHSTREQEVAEVSWAFSTLAGEEHVALVVLAQLKRDAETRGVWDVPQLSDLRESGSIEQDADAVWFVHRPDRLDNSIEAGTSILAIAKQRNGECGQIPLWFEGRYQRFIPRERGRDVDGSEGHEHQAAGGANPSPAANRRSRGRGARGGQPDA